MCVCVRAGNLVVLFDQHAAHERVRLEALLAGSRGLLQSCQEKTIFNC